MKGGCLFGIVLFGLFLSGCQQRIFGVDEAVWNQLNENEKELVIEGYHKNKEQEIAKEQALREKELENERHRREIEAQTAPIYAAANAVSSIWGKQDKEAHSPSSLPIQAISSEFAKKRVTIGGDLFEVSPFTKLSQAWVKGQNVVLTKDDNDLLYPVKIKNVDNGESVNARKSSKGI